MIGNDLLSRAGQVPYQLFDRAALLREMQSSGWRSSARSLAHETLIGRPAGIHLGKIGNAGVLATADHVPFNVMSS